MPLPKGRSSRKLPAPFKRPSIDLDRHGREWKDGIPVQDLRKDDTVAQFGTLLADPEAMTNGEYVIRSIERTSILGGERVVRAFVKK